MPVNVIDKRLIIRSKNFRKTLDKQLNKEFTNIGNQILANSQKRFSSHFSGGKFSSVFSAIRESGFKIQQSAKGDITVFIADMTILDKLTALPPTKALGNIYHFWRILHEGSGLLANAGNSKIFNTSKRSSPYPIQVIVQSNLLEPIFSPGKHAPFFELLNVEGLPGIIVLRHKGFKGHQWFLQNLDLFDEDLSFIRKSINNAINRASIQAGRN